MRRSTDENRGILRAGGPDAVPAGVSQLDAFPRLKIAGQLCLKTQACFTRKRGRTLLKTTGALYPKTRAWFFAYHGLSSQRADSTLNDFRGL
jgi:hypothetical protein